MSSIKTLELYENQLEGKIPRNIWKCTHLEYLILYGNNFSGNIPLEIGNMSMLRWLDLGMNDFQGIHIYFHHDLIAVFILDIHKLHLSYHKLHVILAMIYGRISLIPFTTQFRRNSSRNREAYTTRDIKYCKRLSNWKYPIIHFQHILFDRPGTELQQLIW